MCKVQMVQTTNMDAFSQTNAETLEAIWWTAPPMGALSQYKGTVIAKAAYDTKHAHEISLSAM